MPTPKSVRGAPAAAQKKALLEKDSYRCAVCGVSTQSVPLHVTHIRPFSEGGETLPENLAVLCSNCHAQFNRQPREIEFTAFLVGLLRAHPSFTDVQQEPLIGGHERLRPDILASRQLTGRAEQLIIECTTALVSGSRMTAVAHQLTRYASHVEGRPVLAVPATLSREQKGILSGAQIEVWDLPVLAELFRDQLPSQDGNYYTNLLTNYLLRNKQRPREEELISRLEECEAGKADWPLYQKLVGEILEQLFYPSLNKPISELSDKPKVNRRDFILPNYADKGFWAFLRDKYQADYVVVDAKNYSRRVGKSDVLQIANYLKPHGAGLFGLICSRNGGDESGCEHTLREQWLVHQKLILVLNDDDLSAMLNAKSEQRGPEEVLAAKIEAFRLSM